MKQQLGCVRPGSATGETGATRDETDWTWWTSPSAASGCLAQSIAMTLGPSFTGFRLAGLRYWMIRFKGAQSAPRGLVAAHAKAPRDHSTGRTRRIDCP